MRLVILHISDIHFKLTTSLKPAAAVASCLREIPDQIDHVIVVITGDITFSGKPDEFVAFSPFIEQLRTEIKAITRHDPRFLTIPGNHDCMHPDDTSLRDVVLKAICDSNGLAGSPQLVEQAVSVQANYFTWASEYSMEPNQTDNKTGWVVRASGSEGERIAFLCINSAWMSTLHESQGKLFLPLGDLPSPDNDDVVIALLHHPYNWFESNNARAVRRHLEAVSDIILTGHEHDLSVYTKTTDTGGVEYVEGGLFHCDEEPEHSAFCIIRIDLERKEYETSRYYWDPSRYRCSSRTSRPFVRSSHKQAQHVLRPYQEDFLKDIGAQLTHPSKPLEFNDLYITPSIRRYMKLGGGEGLLKDMIESEQTISTVFSEKVVYFAGDAQSGKTALAKHLFNCALQRGLLPIYIKGERLKNSSPRALQSMLRKEFESQYSHPSFDEFLQAQPNRKVAIIDDLPDSRLNRQSKAKAIEWLRSRHDYVFVFGGDFSHVEEILADMEEGQLVAEMAHFEIVELGYVLRSRLIVKWITLAATSNYDRESLARKVTEIERLIDTVLGKNLLPAHPIFILSMLQQLEAGTSLSTKSGAYGYLYEALITTALNTTSRSVDEIDAKYTYLSEFAWYLRCQKARECDLEEMHQFNEHHRTSYRLAQVPTQLLHDVIESRILVQHGSRIAFRYKYLYYYFLARYIRDNIAEHDATSAVDECVRDLHREECANVIIFLTYLSKDRAIVQKLLDSARDIFRDVSPCNLESHVEFLNKLESAIPVILLPDSDPVDAKQEVLRQADSQYQSRRQSSDTSGLSAEEEPEELDQVLTLNRATKCIQIMGQILRNFAGSIKGPVKKELASECFAVGLRTLNAYYGMLEKHLEVIIDIFAAMIFEKNLYDKEPKERIQLAKKVVFVLTQMLCLGVVERISKAVGSEKLLPTFEDVEESMKSLAAEFIQIGIRMDHGTQFPENRVLDINKRLAGNQFGQSLLRIMVADHFYLFPRNYRVRQRICAKLGIAQSKKMLIGGSERKSRH